MGDTPQWHLLTLRGSDQIRKSRASWVPVSNDAFGSEKAFAARKQIDRKKPLGKDKYLREAVRNLIPQKVFSCARCPKDKLVGEIGSLWQPSLARSVKTGRRKAPERPIEGINITPERIVEVQWDNTMTLLPEAG